jgi:hypothetical protein
MNEIQVLVEKELADEKFQGRTHGRPSVYRDGCRGPLCLKAVRDRQRRQRNGGAGSMAIVDALLEPYQAAHEKALAEMAQARGA